MAGLRKGVTNTYVRRNHKPNQTVLNKIVKATGVNIEWLRTGEGDPFLMTSEKPFDIDYTDESGGKYITSDQLQCLQAIRLTMQALQDVVPKIMANPDFAARMVGALEMMRSGAEAQTKE